MGANYILSIDQGTTGSTIVVFAVSLQKEMTVIGRCTVDYPQHYPETGWVEHDLDELWQSVCAAADQAIDRSKANKDFSVNKIATVGITNQRETLCVFDRKTSKPLMRAIVWQCKRSTSICQEWRNNGFSEQVKAKTGLVLDPYFSGSKLAWILKNRPDVAVKIESGEAVIGTIDTFILHKLTGGVTHATDASNASRTLMYDIGKGTFDGSLIEMVGLKNRDALPRVLNSADQFGKTKGCAFLPDGIAINGILGDQQAALAGQTCFEPGEAKCTYGTGAFMLLNTGDKMAMSKNGLLTTVAWQIGGARTYCFEGSSFIAGAAMQFLRDQLGWLKKASDSESMAAEARGAPEVVFVPSLAGLGAPDWNPNARGAFFGLTRGTTQKQLIRAALEGVAFQVNDLMDAMNRDAVAAVKILRVDGGAAANNLLMQMQANFSSVTVDRPVNLETTASGAALFAGLGAGIFESFSEMRSARRPDRIFSTDASTAAVEMTRTQLAAWDRAKKAVQVFAGN
jgi:glycerol kinase